MELDRSASSQLAPPVSPAFQFTRHSTHPLALRPQAVGAVPAWPCTARCGGQHRRRRVPSLRGGAGFGRWAARLLLAGWAGGWRVDDAAVTLGWHDGCSKAGWHCHALGIERCAGCRQQLPCAFPSLFDALDPSLPSPRAACRRPPRCSGTSRCTLSWQLSRSRWRYCRTQAIPSSSPQVNP